MSEKETLETSEEIWIPKKRSPVFRVIAFLVAIGIIISSVEAYFYFIHPEPVNIPKLKDVQVFLAYSSDEAFTSHNADEVREVIDLAQDNIKQVANFIVSKSCHDSDQVCQTKALFYFVRDEINYVSDDNFHDELENPLTVLKTGGADCEDMAVLLIALEKAIGNKVRLVFVPGHAYAQVSIPNYKGEKWINMEATCDNCQFGELPTEVGLQKKEFFEI